MIVKNRLVALFLKLTSVSIFVSIITLFSNFIVAKFAEKEMYADFTVYQSYYLILSNFIPLGITAAIVFFNDQCSEVELFGIVRRYVLYIIPAVSILSYVTLFFLANSLTAKIDAIIFVYIVISAYAQSVINILISFYQITNRYKMFVKIAFFNVAMLLLSCVLGVFVFNHVLSIFLLYGVMSFLTAAAFYYITSRSYPFAELDDKIVKAVLMYSIPTALNSSVISFLVTGDKVLVGTVVDDKTLIAEYGYASFVASLFLFVVNNIATTIGVFLAQLKRDSQHIKAFSETVRLNQCKNIYIFLAALAFAPVVYLGQYAFNITNIKTYLTVSVFILCSYCIHGLSKMYLGFLNSFKRSFFILMSGVLSCIFIYFFNDYFYHTFGIIGVSMLFLFGAIIYLVLLVLGCYQMFQKYEK